MSGSNARFLLASVSMAPGKKYTHPHRAITKTINVNNICLISDNGGFLPANCGLSPVTLDAGGSGSSKSRRSSQLLARTLHTHPKVMSSETELKKMRSLTTISSHLGALTIFSSEHAQTLTASFWRTMRWPHCSGSMRFFPRAAHGSARGRGRKAVSVLRARRLPGRWPGAVRPGCGQQARFRPPNGSF